MLERWETSAGNSAVAESRSVKNKERMSRQSAEIFTVGHDPVLELR
jgi:hypothetical protein